MNLKFDVDGIMKRLESVYSKKINIGLEVVKMYIDIRTPVDTGELKEHNKISGASLVGGLLSGSIYNDLGEYEIDVEEGEGVPYWYHDANGNRLFGSRQIGAHMFEDGFIQAKIILMNLLRA